LIIKRDSIKIELNLNTSSKMRKRNLLKQKELKSLQKNGIKATKDEI